MILFGLVILLLLKNILRDRTELVSPRTFFLLGYLIVLGRGALMGSLYGYAGNEQTFQDVIFWATAGLIAFEVGTWSKSPPRLIRKVFVKDYKFNYQRLYLVAIVCLLIGVAAVLYLAYGYSLGVVDYLMALRSLHVDEGEGPIGERYVGWISNIGIAAGGLSFGILLRHHWSRSKQVILIVIIVIAGLLTVHGGGRFSIFQYGCALALLWFLSKSESWHLKVRKYVGIAILLLLTLTSASIIGTYRDYGLQELKTVDTNPEQMLNDTNILTSTVDTFEFFPKRHDYLYGSTFAILPATFVPRAMWPEKPELLGVIIVRLRNVDELSYSEAVSTVGELYANFGVLGIPIGMFFYGLVCRWLFVLYRRNQENVQFVILYVLSLPFFAMHVRGEFVTVWAHYLSFAIPLYAGIRFCRRSVYRRRYEPLSSAQIRPVGAGF